MRKAGVNNIPKMSEPYGKVKLTSMMMNDLLEFQECRIIYNMAAKTKNCYCKIDLPIHRQNLHFLCYSK